MSMKFETIWREVRSSPGSIFLSYGIDDIKHVLWHTRPKADVYRFTFNHRKDNDFYFLKIFKGNNKDKYFNNEYETLLLLQKSFLGEKNINVVEPIMNIPSICAFITKEFKGVDLYTFFKKNAGMLNDGLCVKKSEESIGKLVEWFLIFQSSNLLLQVDSYDLHYLLKNACDDLDKVCKYNMIDNVAKDKIESALFQKYKKLKQKNSYLVPSNVDTKLWNFLTDEAGEIRALDFVGISYGLPTLDFSRIWVGLNWLKIFPYISSRKITSMQSFLVKRISTVDGFDLEEFYFTRLCVMIELVAFYSKIRTDKYRRKIRNIVFFKTIRMFLKKSLEDCLHDGA